MYQNSTKNESFDFLEQICPKRIIPVENRKSEHRYSILNVQISLGTKFELKLNFLSSWDKFL